MFKLRQTHRSGFTLIEIVIATGRGAWRGPYIDDYSFTDPWGYAYVVNVYYAPGGGYPGSVRHFLYVLSAGPNGTWETTFFGGNSEVLLGDDIGTVVVVR